LVCTSAPCGILQRQANGVVAIRGRLRVYLRRTQKLLAIRQVNNRRPNLDFLRSKLLAPDPRSTIRQLTSKVSVVVAYPDVRMIPNQMSLWVCAYKLHGVAQRRRHIHNGACFLGIMPKAQRDVVNRVNYIVMYYPECALTQINLVHFT